MVLNESRFCRAPKAYVRRLSFVVAFLAISLLINTLASGAIIKVNFTAAASTVTGTPFGFTDLDIQGDIFGGSFTYDTATAGTVLVPDVGTDYKHALGTSAFTVNINGTIISGSTEMVYRTSSMGNQFFFVDGTEKLIFSSFPVTTMFVNGSADSQVGVSLNITDSSNPFSSGLPDPFPYDTNVTSVPPHTFLLKDGNLDSNGLPGQINWQFQSLSPVPEPSSLALLGIGAVGMAVVRRLRKKHAAG